MVGFVLPDWKPYQLLFFVVLVEQIVLQYDYDSSWAVWIAWYWY